MTAEANAMVPGNWSENFSKVSLKFSNQHYRTPRRLIAVCLTDSSKVGYTFWNWIEQETLGL